MPGSVMIVAGLEFTRMTRKPSAFSALQACAPGIVELAGLSDDDRAGADDEDGIDIVAARHLYPFRSSISAVKRSNR